MKILAVPLILLRTVLRFIRDLDGILSYVTSLPLKSKYPIEGSCKKRGVCCQNIAIYLSPSFWRRPVLKVLAIRYYCFVYNFEFLKTDIESQVILFRCNYLKDQGCSIHWKRPLICRQYPKARFFEKPQFLPGCGYSLASRKTKKTEKIKKSNYFIKIDRK